MFQEFFARSPFAHLPVIGMSIFFIVFVMVVLHVLFEPRGDAGRSRVAALPLEDGDGGAAQGRVGK
jgi:hypothetical protein